MPVSSGISYAQITRENLVQPKEIVNNPAAVETPSELNSMMIMMRTLLAKLDSQEKSIKSFTDRLAVMEDRIQKGALSRKTK